MNPNVLERKRQEEQKAIENAFGAAQELVAEQERKINGFASDPDGVSETQEETASDETAVDHDPRDEQEQRDGMTEAEQKEQEGEQNSPGQDPDATEAHPYVPVDSAIIADMASGDAYSQMGNTFDGIVDVEPIESSGAKAPLVNTFADRYADICRRRVEEDDVVSRFVFRRCRFKQTRKQSRRHSHRNHGAAVFSFIIMFIVTVFSVLTLSAAALFYAVSSWTDDMPDIFNMESYAATGVTNIYASDGKTVLARIRVVDRVEVPSDEISQYLKDATVATEDIRFYEHAGIDPIGTVRAITATASGGQQGGSTITQQLVRNTVLLDEMQDISIKRKVREMLVATEVEAAYDKDEILTLYLNIVNYGDGCYGVEAASRNYFNCHADELTLSQAALIAGIPQAPTHYNLRTNYEDAIDRRIIILDHMLQYGYITQDQYDEAIADRPEIADSTSSDDDISPIAPYFVDYVKELIASGAFGPAEKYANGGFEIVTTLDVHDQQVANEVVADVMSSYEGMDVALASVDPDNGDVKAMVGGLDYEENKFNLATQMSRQAGSSFKTFALVAALQEGVSPSSVMFPSNGPIRIGNWKVDNDSGAGGGNVNLTSAFANSYNTVFAMLTHGIGADKVAQVAKDCGIESNLNPVDSICLGTQGINPLEMANAYATIANGGTRHDVVAVKSIKTTAGDVLYEHEYTDGEKVLSDEVAQTAIKVMETVLTQGTGSSARLYSGQVAAGKTGTSENGRDLWFVGFTPQMSTAVWTGYRDDTESPLYGNTTSTPIWRDFMNGALEGDAIESFPSGATSPSYSDWSTADFTKGLSSGASSYSYSYE